MSTRYRLQACSRVRGLLVSRQKLDDCSAWWIVKWSNVGRVVMLSILYIDAGECSRRSKCVCTAWTRCRTTCWWWTSCRVTTSATDTASTRPVGSSPARLIHTCPDVSTSTRTRRPRERSGWSRLSHSTNSNSPTTCSTTTDTYVSLAPSDCRPVLWCACLSVCPHMRVSVSIRPNFKKFVIHVHRASRRCNTLRTSGFVDDVTFFFRWPYGGLPLPQPLRAHQHSLHSIG